jgi:uncharacterized membrane protein
MISGKYQNQQGFLALTATLIIFAILIILLGIVGKSAFYNRFNVLDYENKKVSQSMAEACAETALVNLAKNLNYQTTDAVHGDAVTVDALSNPVKKCQICPISGAGPFAITTRARYNKAYTNLAVNATAGSTNFTINSWDEQPTYAGNCAVP